MGPLDLDFRRAALGDIHEASAYYAGREDDDWLVLRFLRAVDLAAAKAAANPRTYRKVYGNFRRVIVTRFPYLLYYLAHTDRVEVFGVIHAKRSPWFLAGRLE